MTHEQRMVNLKVRKRVAKNKRKEAALKKEIFLLKHPFLANFKFNKVVVIFCLTNIVIYTIAAFWLQRYTSMEISSTLTTCFFAFFGTELIGLASIRVSDNVTQKKNKSADMEDNGPVG